MKKRFGTFVLFACLAATPLAAEEVWTPIGPWGGWVTCLAVHPNNSQILYAGTGTGGLFRSINGGVSWQPYSDNLPSRFVKVVTIAPSAPNILYAVIERNAEGEVWQSTDGGASWTNRFENDLFDVQIYALAVHPRNPRIVFVGSNYGLHRTTDGGLSWSQVGTQPTFQPSTIVFDPARPSNVYAGSNFNLGVFKSTDGGLSWRSSSAGLEGTSIRVLALAPGNSRVLYAATPAGVFKSADAGGTWQPRSGGLTDVDIFSLIAVPGAGRTPAMIWAGTATGIFRSRNSAASWERASLGLRKQPITALAAHPRVPRILWAGSSGVGLFRTANGGERWQVSNFGLSASLVWSFAVDPETPEVFWATLSSDTGVWRSPDGGVIWEGRSRGLSTLRAGALVADPHEPRTVWLSIGEGLFRSADSGLTWERNAGLASPEVGRPASALRFDPHDSRVIWIGTNRGLFRSPDHGATWNRIPGIDDTVVDFLLDPENPQVLHVSLGSVGFWRSTDGGATWNTIQVPGLDDFTIFSLARDPAEPARLFAAGRARSGILLESSNGGETWQIRPPNYEVGSTTLRALLVDPYDGSVWAGGKGLHHISRDGVWSLVISDLNVMDLDLDPDNPDALFVTTLGRGVLRIRR